jgi:hypothetical protein
MIRDRKNHGRAFQRISSPSIEWFPDFDSINQHRVRHIAKEGQADHCPGKINVSEQDKIGRTKRPDRCAQDEREGTR